MHGGKRFIALSAALAAVVVLAGCAGTRSPAPRTHFVAFDDEQRHDYLAATPQEYRLQEGDEISVIFPYLEGMDKTGVFVLPDGSVTLPVIDRVVVAGRTTSEADSLITSLYARMYRDPDVSLIVESTVGRRVYVLGEVKAPGLYHVPTAGIGVLSAISAAGGFTDDAKKSNTILIRLNEEGYLCQEIDLSRIHTVEGISYTSVGLESYDVIYVPRSLSGDFAYFASSVLKGVLDITGIISDVRYIKSGAYGR